MEASLKRPDSSNVRQTRKKRHKRVISDSQPVSQISKEVDANALNDTKVRRITEGIDTLEEFVPEASKMKKEKNLSVFIQFKRHRNLWHGIR